MDGVVTVLDPLNYQKVLSLWQDLTVHCGVPEIKNHFLPHFSWHVSESLDCDKVNVLLEELARRSQPFTAQTAGIGLFPGEKPVVYIPLVKDRPLLDYHEMIWSVLNTLAVQSSPYYSPQNWVPHITVFFDELYDPLPAGWQTRTAMGCVINELVELDLSWTLMVDNIAYGCMEAEMSFKRYQFGS